MNQHYLLALDIGTTNAKAVIFTHNGSVIAAVEEMITSHYPQTGWVEQDPDAIEKSSITAIRDAIKKANIDQTALTALGFSSAMHSLICVDANGKPLSRALIWSDRRSQQQADNLKQTHPELYDRTGLPLHPMSPLTKLLWMKETNYQPYIDATYFMSIKEYIIYKWFGKRLTDHAMAAATGMYNAKTNTWDEEALDICNVKQTQLSSIVSPTTQLPPINKQVAHTMGVSAKLPCMIGSADGQLANLGSGAILPGEVAVSMGTSGALRQMVDTHLVSPNQQTFCCAFTEEQAIIGGATNNGGITVQWLKDLLKCDDNFDTFIGLADTVKPGADGLYFHPYINGERAPLWQPDAKGNFFGIRITHKRAHFVRAVLEGITFNLYHINQTLEQIAGPSEKLYVNGGLARSDTWVHMLANIFNRPVYVSESHHSAAWGAAWTAHIATNKTKTFTDIKANIPIKKIIQPDKNEADMYQEIYQSYYELATVLADYF